MSGRTIDYQLVCSECGYDLRTLSYDAACPECGVSILLTLCDVAERAKLRVSRPWTNPQQTSLGTVACNTKHTLSVVLFVSDAMHFAVEATADCLVCLDAMIAAQAERLDALGVHKRGLMQQLFPSPDAATS